MIGIGFEAVGFVVAGDADHGLGGGVEDGVFLEEFVLFGSAGGRLKSGKGVHNRNWIIGK